MTDSALVGEDLVHLVHLDHAVRGEDGQLREGVSIQPRAHESSEANPVVVHGGGVDTCNEADVISADAETEFSYDNEDLRDG